MTKSSKNFRSHSQWLSLATFVHSYVGLPCSSIRVLMLVVQRPTEHRLRQRKYRHSVSTTVARPRSWQEGDCLISWHSMCQDIIEWRRHHAGESPESQVSGNRHAERIRMKTWLHHYRTFPYIPFLTITVCTCTFTTTGLSHTYHS